MPEIMMQNILVPVLALVCWTFVVLIWMYITRIPAMYQAGIRAAKIKRKSDLDALPSEVHQVADNYNHLHEQPTLFYALCLYSHLTGLEDVQNTFLAWAYVLVRVAHSLIQCTFNFVPLRFLVFNVGSALLVIIAVRNVMALFNPA